MTINEAVEKVLNKANKNSTNDNAGIDKGRIILALNESQNKFMDYILEKKNEDDLRLIQKLLVPAKLKKGQETTDSQFFILPTDFFDFSNCTCTAKQGKCIVPIDVWEEKSQNFHEVLRDENNKPSFYFRESFYFLQDNQVRVFRDNFTIQSLDTIYYRYPKKVNIEGIIDINGVSSKNTDPEFDDRAMDRIISIAVKELDLNAESFQKIQPDTTRIINKF